jgi:hypothetical protein
MKPLRAGVWMVVVLRFAIPVPQPRRTSPALCQKRLPGSPTRAVVARDGVELPGSPTRAVVARDGVELPGR